MPLGLRTVLNGIDLRIREFWNILIRRKKLEIKKKFLIDIFDIFEKYVVICISRNSYTSFCHFDTFSVGFIQLPTAKSARGLIGKVAEKGFLG